MRTENGMQIDAHLDEFECLWSLESCLLLHYPEKWVRSIIWSSLSYGIDLLKLNPFLRSDSDTRTLALINFNTSVVRLCDMFCGAMWIFRSIPWQ